ncbi:MULTISPECIES: type IV pilin [unclassified Halorubrum]|uniref:type IV pilin n=1 Tax=unclassified Halorubrum TaxID=2642239 RepID=UPI000B997C33|nr:MULTISPECIES: type IV pilin [unclassified Halorubrum]OYR41067.1 type IV pilin [Halorubrum sp. Hd13]OYR48167.1 type IV pilin [Halorubrum sp. Eb13]OYR54863.1 type IV pilin [Halorubrum sp. Ea1]
MRAFRNDERGFTPIAGTGLLVGVVVLLLAIVGAAMFGLIDGVAPPDAEFQVEREGGDIVVVAAGPDPVAAEELYVRGEDPDGEVEFGAWPGDGVVEPGDRVVVPNATGNEQFDVVWEPVAFDTRETLGTYDGEDSAISEWAEEEPGADPLGGGGGF